MVASPLMPPSGPHQGRTSVVGGQGKAEIGEVGRGSLKKRSEALEWEHRRARDRGRNRGRGSRGEKAMVEVEEGSEGRGCRSSLVSSASRGRLIRENSGVTRWEIQRKECKWNIGRGRVSRILYLEGSGRCVSMSLSSPVEKLFITSSRPIRGNQFYFRDVRGLHMNTFSLQSIPWRYSPSLFLIFYSVLPSPPLDIPVPATLICGPCW